MRSGVLKVAVVVLMLGSCCEVLAGEFAIYRGVNISHWLSQSGRRGQDRRDFFAESDVKRIGKLGFDHIRLPVDEEQLWDESGEIEAEAFELLHSAIGWCNEADMRVVVDLHILRSHHFNAKDKPLWTDVKEQEKFFGLWRQLSGQLKKYSTDMVAYELMNEPVADDADDWNRLVAKAIAVIRQSEPKRKVVVGSNRWQSTSTFDQLKVPKGDRNIILSFHFYSPMLITHYTAGWTGVGKYTGPVNYPGRLVAEKDMEGLSEDVARTVAGNNGTYDRARLESMLAKPLKLAKELDLPLYCGEWGAYVKTPREARVAWYRDMVSILDEHKIARANWDYNGGFAIVGGDGKVDTEIVGMMVGGN